MHIKLSLSGARACHFQKMFLCLWAQYKKLKSLKSTAPVLLSSTSSLSISESFTNRWASFCVILHQHRLLWTPTSNPSKENCSEFEYLPIFASPRGGLRREVACTASAHLSCCFYVSRPCWMQINKIQNKVGNSRCKTAKSLFCWIFVMQRKPEQMFSLHLPSQIKWVAKTQNLASFS